jgi:prepilin-type processing-associated H-X9-DG protein
MSRIEDNKQNQKLKTKLLAIASLLVCILGIIIIVLRIGFYRPWWNEYVARNIIGLLGIVGLVLGFVALRKISKRIAAITLLAIFCSFFLLIFSFSHFISIKSIGVLQMCSFTLSIVFLLGLFAIPKIIEWKSKPKEKFKGSNLAVLGMVLGVILTDCWFVETCAPVQTALGMACAYNLQQISKAMLLYSNDNNSSYPEPNRWCDLLLEYEQIELKHFLCPGVTFQWRRQVFPWPIPKNEKCYYAMNPNCEPNSPPNTVLLFETKGGWNKFDGPELLTFENHLGRCVILFNDGHVEIVSQKHIPDLNWGHRKDPNNK